MVIPRWLLTRKACGAAGLSNQPTSRPQALSTVDAIPEGLGTPEVATLTHPDGEEGPAHDAYTRLLHRTQSDGTTLWEEVAPLVELQEGMLVLDDSTLDKP